MELRLALLLGLLAWAAAAATGCSAQAPACEPSNLATQITLFCLPEEDVPTAPCCEPVFASVDLGVPCVCRVAAQPQLVLARLNASHLLALYTACGGLLRTHIAAACQGPSPLAAIAPPPPAAPHHRPPPPPAPVSDFAATSSKPKRQPPRAGACNSSALASMVVEQCPSTEQPTPPGCCVAVLETVDSADRDCLCSVSEDFEFAESNIGVDMVWRFYQTCGGRKEAVPKNLQSCAHAPARSPPPPPPPRQPPPPPPPSRPARQGRLHGWRLGVTVVLSVLGGIVAVWLSSWFVSWLVSLCRTPAAGVVAVSTAAQAAGALPVTVSQQDGVAEPVPVGAGGGLLPLHVQAPPPTAPRPIMFSPGHMKALVKDLVQHLEWAPPRPASAVTGPNMNVH